MATEQLSDDGAEELPGRTAAVVERRGHVRVLRGQRSANKWPTETLPMGRAPGQGVPRRQYEAAMLAECDQKPFLA